MSPKAMRLLPWPRSRPSGQSSAGPAALSLAARPPARDTLPEKKSRLRFRGGTQFILAAVLVAICAGLVAAVVLSPWRTERTLKGPASAPFTLDYSEDWRELTKAELRKLPGPPLGGVQLGRREGFLAVQSSKPVRGDFAGFVAGLTRELRKHVADFQKRSSQIVETRAGSAWLYSYSRKQMGTVHVVVVAPAAGNSYLLEAFWKDKTVAAPGAIEKMIRSFDG